MTADEDGGQPARDTYRTYCDECDCPLFGTDGHELGHGSYCDDCAKDYLVPDGGSGRYGNRVETAYCADCGPTRRVWTDKKHQECWHCGESAYDDHATFVEVGKKLGGRFLDTDTDHDGGNR